MARRPLAVLLVVLATAVIGGGLVMLLQKTALPPSTSGFVTVLLAQLSVFLLWWMRITRLSALTAISPGPVASPPAATIPATMPPPSSEAVST